MEKSARIYPIRIGKVLKNLSKTSTWLTNSIQNLNKTATKTDKPLQIWRTVSEILCISSCHEIICWFFYHQSILNLNDIKMARQNQTTLSLFFKKL